MWLRRLWGWRCRPGPLKDYYAAALPDGHVCFQDAPLLAIDLEATGLDLEQDHVVAIGAVPIDQGRIRLQGARYWTVRPPRRVGRQAATVHGLLDDRLALAPDLAQVMPEVLKTMAGRVLVAHYAVMERVLLSRACRELYGQPLAVPVIDTAELALRRLAPGDRQQGALRLDSCRRRFGLPAYQAHDALADAEAAAELLLAQAAALGPSARLKDLL